MKEKRVEDLERENRRMKDRIDSLEKELRNCRIRLEELSKKMDLDYLTGVLNREGICRLISGCIEGEEGSMGALCFLDLDNFKQINDRFGHSSGDEALRAIARTLQDSTRSSDPVGRFGGDEFLIYMKDCTGKEDILERAGVICGRIRALSLPVSLTASIGIACCPEHGRAFQELIDKADAALYRSKCAGKDQISIYGL